MGVGARREESSVVSSVLWTSILLSSAWGFDPFALEGTQPHDLNQPLEPSSNCELCHAGYAESPTDAWQGTMMANAVRDPLFLAALTIAEQDLADSGNFCLRCHTPNGWLEGRCLPGDGSALSEEDIDSGISCDACHRMVEAPGGSLIGNAQYTIADDASKRGTIGSELSTHGVIADPYQADGDMCGVCHEVSNPALNDFPIELTWTEWVNSDFAVEGETCQDCHMKVTRGYAANLFGLPDRDIHVHRFVGANAWIPEVLAAEYPELGREEAFLQTAADARELLLESAILEVMPPKTQLRPNSDGQILIRVENLTGHKLPSGYPEGRRIWLEVTVEDAQGELLFSSGVYDPVIADLPSDPQVRIYQALLGTDGRQSYHMVEQNDLIQDTRIPPRGFLPNANTQPIGIEYPMQPDDTMAHWDLAPYEFFIPQGTEGPLKVRAVLWHQTISKSYVEFLRDSNYTDDRGDELYRMWEEHGKSPPEYMGAASASLTLGPAYVAPPITALPEPEPKKDGCLCAVTGGVIPSVALAWSALLLRRRREA